MFSRKFKLNSLKTLLMILVLFDLSIAALALFYPHSWISFGHLDSSTVPGAPYRQGTIEPLFLRGVGILWLLAAYVQFLAFKNPEERPWAINLSIVFRFFGGTFELVEVLFLLPMVKFDYKPAYWLLGGFVACDYICIGLMVLLLWSLKIKWWAVDKKI
ncbi:MAG: hypothetical protein GXP49_17500 [Deltaproteobacteria bacterium]|nr:hypothetical protein [Deltaproteobacteria bacterium]